MRQYTTPTIELTVKDTDLTGFTVWASFEQGKHSLDTEDVDCTLDASGNTVVSVTLSQLETASFHEGTANVQVNWIDLAGSRDATKVKAIAIEPNLLKRVL